MKEAVTCKQIKKTYGSGPSAVHALRGVDLAVHRGELMMLVGPSGSGKTTLLSIISGILSQDSGECLIFNQDLNSLPNDSRTNFRGKQIGFVFQAFNLLPMLTARENVSIPLIINGIDIEEALVRAGELLSQVGLAKRVDAYPPQMSGGEQQRVAIARGCIHKPQIIVCDEPTSALDHETGHAILELLKSIVKEQNCALIIVTHDARIFEFADRMLKMEDGRIIHDSRVPFNE